MLKHNLKEHTTKESPTGKPKPRMTKGCESGDSHQCQGHRHAEDTSHCPTLLRPAHLANALQPPLPVLCPAFAPW